MRQEKKNVSNFSELLNKEIRANCEDQLYKGQSPVRNAPNLDVANNRWLYRRDLTLWTDNHTCYGFGYFVKDGQLMTDSLYGPQPVTEDGVILPGSPGAFLACQDFSKINLLDRPETPQLPKDYQGFQVAEDSPLREAQREAVRKADAPLSFIWGPPGTGKTFTIVNTVKAILSVSSNKVLVTSTADKAVEAVVNGLLSLQLGSKLQFCKDEGEAQICKEDIRLHDYWRQQAKAKLPAEKGQSAAELSLRADRCLSQAKVIATNSLSAVAKLTYDKVERITHLIIDEASMMPMWMVSLLAGLLKSRNPELRIILVGDPKQLPAVVISKELEGHPMGMNVYNYMGINDPQYCTPENIVTLLDSTSRMPDLLTRAISRAWYSDALVALRKGEYSPLFAGRPQVDFWSDNYPLFWPFSSRINMLGEADRPERCNRNYNVAEAAHATSLVLACKANNRTCLVIAPYNNQVNLINHWLDKNGVSDVRAVSVHKAQGQEADIVIWSVCFDANKKFMCRHNSPQSAVAQTLANVALSRAKQQVIVLGAYPSQPTVAGQFLSLIAPLIQEQQEPVVKESAIEVVQSSPPKPKQLEVKPQEKECNMTYIGAYAGIGARRTPQEILNYMSDQARILESKGLILRTGDACGADKAFREATEHKLVYAPDQHIERWARHEVSLVCDTEYSQMKLHTQNLLARNMYQLFGSGARKDARQPSMFVLYWSLPDPRWSTGIHNNNYYNCSGGTRYAVRVACNAGIPTFNLYNQMGHWETYRDSGFDPLNALSVVDERKQVPEEPEKTPEANLQASPHVVKPVKKTNPWGASEDLIQALMAELK